MNPANSAPSLLITGLGLDDQARALDAAEARYQTEIAALTRPDGKPLYSQAESAERRAAAQTALAATIDASHAAAAGARTALDVASASASADPAWSLAVTDLTRIQALEQRARQDAATLPIPDLVKRIRAAANSKDVQIVLAWTGAARALQQRADTTDAEQQKSLTAAMFALADAAGTFAPAPDPRAAEVEQKISALITRAAQVERSTAGAPVRTVTPF